MSKLIDVSKLNQTLIVYDRLLRSLPFSTIKEVAAALNINVMNLQGEHAIINERRRAGGTQSYKIGKDFSYLEKLLGYDPSVIKPQDVVFITRENSKKYDDLELMLVGGQPVSNITKKHPLELKVASMLVRSHIEDVVYSLFHAVRDDDSTTPLGAFNGFYSKLNDLFTKQELSIARGNYRITGSLDAPASTSDTEAYDKLVEFIATAHPALRSSNGGAPQLVISQGALANVRAAFRNKVKEFEYPNMDKVIASLREDAFCPGLVISTHECIGKGSKLILQKVGNMDLAFNTQAAAQFCQVRNIYEDPNDWQFWLQAGYDTRIRDWHEKVFCTNEQQNTCLDLAGDYTKVGGIMIDITGTDSTSAKATINGLPALGSKGKGAYYVNLTPGTYTVDFAAVADRVVASKTVTVEEGKMATAVGAYKKQAGITVASSNNEHGTVAKSPSKETYIEGDEVVLTATPAEGYEFTKWDDDNTDNPRTVVATGVAKTYTATFSAE